MKPLVMDMFILTNTIYVYGNLLTIHTRTHKITVNEYLHEQKYKYCLYNNNFLCNNNSLVADSRTIWTQNRGKKKDTLHAITCKKCSIVSDFSLYKTKFCLHWLAVIFNLEFTTEKNILKLKRLKILYCSIKTGRTLR